MAVLCLALVFSSVGRLRVQPCLDQDVLGAECVYGQNVRFDYPCSVCEIFRKAQSVIYPLHVTIVGSGVFSSQLQD